MASVSSDGTATAESGVDSSGLPQPAAAMLGHEERLAAAEQSLRRALAQCDSAMGNHHLLPSEFFANQELYTQGRDQALLQDGTLRESKTVYKSDGFLEDVSYEDWIIRCDLFFKSNAATFEAARATEDSLRAKHARPDAGAGEPELSMRVVSNDDALHEENPLMKHLIKRCKVEDGKIVSCGEPVSGEAPVFKDGLWRVCTIDAGQVDSCGDGINGSAIISESGLIRSCDLVEGNPTACTDGWLGYAPLRAP